MRRTLEKIKERKAITLIALVVTIVVLLILAGVSISLILDNNGIIQKSKDVKLETRASQVEDEVGLWKQNNFINKEAGKAQEEADTMLASLISRNLLKEDEVDRENEIITIKKNDGSILKEISYSQVTINISRNPETEKSGAVILTVDSVEGMTIPTITSEDELNEYIDSLSETQKKEIIKTGYVKLVNLKDPTANCETFEDVLEWVKNAKGQEITEEIFWSEIRDLDYEVFRIIKREYYNEEKRIIEGYTVTNPDGETSNTYIATENGTYTFKVKDNVTGKTYTKKVEVTNIDKSAHIVTSEMIEKTIVLEKLQYVFIVLKDLKTNEYVNFEKAYILFNNKKIEITSAISTEDGKKGIFALDIGVFLYQEGILERSWEIEQTNQIIILEKDNKYYMSVIDMGDFHIVL